MTINNYFTVRVGKRYHYLPFDDTTESGCRAAWVEAKRLASHNAKPLPLDEVLSLWRAAPIPAELPIVGLGPPLRLEEDEEAAA